MIYRHMDYIPFDIKNPHCLHVMLSNRAYCAIINEAFEYGTDETGGLLLGYIIGRKWYVVEVIDPGTNNTIHQTGLFQWDQNYVNKMADRMRLIYRYPPTILGFWHRHPGSMDYFSQQDVESTQKNLQGARKGLISMLVNIDPALRMTFYHCHGPHFMPVRYDVGDEYFPVELLEYATPEQISQRHVENQRGKVVKISYRRILPPPAAPGVTPRKSVRADNDVPEQTGQADTDIRQEPVPKNPSDSAPKRKEDPVIQEEPAPEKAPDPAAGQSDPVVQEEPEAIAVPEQPAPETVSDPMTQEAPEKTAGHEEPTPQTASEPVPEQPATEQEEPEAIAAGEEPAPEADTPREVFAYEVILVEEPAPEQEEASQAVETVPQAAETDNPPPTPESSEPEKEEEKKSVPFAGFSADA